MAEQKESSWWSYASTAWNTVQETAKDFTDSLQEENEETINQIKQTVDSEKISNQISTATNSINTFLNTTLQTIHTQTANTNKTDTKAKKQIAPKPFEKEKATYSLDPCSMKQHKEKYSKFIQFELGLTDDEICLKGRHLLEINTAICTYFDNLVPNEIDEITFWKRYFYWKYQTQLREILISKHIGNNNQKNDENDIYIHQQEQEQEQEQQLEQEQEQEQELELELEEVKLGDCENAKVENTNENGNVNADENENENEKGNIVNANENNSDTSDPDKEKNKDDVTQNEVIIIESDKYNAGIVNDNNDVTENIHTSMNDNENENEQEEEDWADWD